jgi:hypothetical protein
VVSTAELARPELRVVPITDVAAELGVSTEAISEAVRIATIGDIGANLAKFDVGERQVPIRVQLEESARGDPRFLESLKVATGAGAAVPLSAVARFDLAQGPTAIDRYDRMRRVVIGADLVGDVALGKAVERVMALPAAKSLPTGVEIKQFGDAEIMGEVRDELLSLVAIALFGYLAKPTAVIAFYTQDLLLEFVGGVTGAKVVAPAAQDRVQLVDDDPNIDPNAVAFGAVFDLLPEPFHRLVAYLGDRRLRRLVRLLRVRRGTVATAGREPAPRCSPRCSDADPPDSGFVWPASRLISLSPLITALRHSAAAQLAHRLTARPRHVIAMLRAQFATATSLIARINGIDLQLFLQALAENQYARILAEPNLVAMSGEEASFLAGGQFPDVVQARVGVREDQVRRLDRILRQRGAERADAVEQGGERGPECLLVAGVHRLSQRGVEDVQLVRGRVIDPELALAENPDDHELSPACGCSAGVAGLACAAPSTGPLSISRFGAPPISPFSRSSSRSTSWPPRILIMIFNFR